MTGCPFYTGLHSLRDELELCVAVRMEDSFQGFSVSLQAVALCIKEGPYRDMSDPVALSLKMRRKGTEALGSPQKRRFRIAHRAAFHESPQVGKKSFIGGFERFPAGACPPNPSFRQKTNACQFTNPLGNHAAGHPRYPVNCLESAPSDGLRLRGGPEPPSFLVKMGPYGLKSGAQPIGHRHATIMTAGRPKVKLIYEHFLSCTHWCTPGMGVNLWGESPLYENQG